MNGNNAGGGTPAQPGGHKGRPTVYKGIEMRSRLEADYAAHLDRSGVKWEYEPTCFAGPKGQWLPDFRHHKRIRFNKEDGLPDEFIPVYTEIKPVSFVDRLIYPFHPDWDRSTARVGDILSRHEATIDKFIEQHLAVEELLGDLTLKRRFGGAVHRAPERHLAEHHLRVALVVLVDRDLGAVLTRDLLRVDPRFAL